jgi:hypothetical protein
MITNPQEEIEILQEEIDANELIVEEIEAAIESGADVSEIDMKRCEIYSDIVDLQIELLDFIEEEQEMVDTKDVAEV